MRKIILAILMPLALGSCAGIFDSKNQVHGPAEPQSIEDCAFAREIIVELNEDALLQGRGVVNERMTRAARITLYWYLQANREMYYKYVQWVVENCKEA